MVIALRVGLVIIAFVTVVVTNLDFFVPKSIDCRTSVDWPEATPHGALWPREIIHWSETPARYTTIVGWINAVTAIPCFDAEAVRPLVEIRKFSIIAIDQAGNESQIETIDPRDRTRFVGRLFPRVPRWFGETEGRNETEIVVGGEDGIALLLDQVPLRVYHAWTEPRVIIDPTLRYAIEIEARISATARLQLGLDYWRDLSSDYAGFDPSCEKSNNCEGFVSDWLGDTSGEFQTFRAPKYLSSPLTPTVTEEDRE